MPDKFSIVKKGYNPSEVDSYIEGLETVIKSYKEKDSAIKNAIINAQLAADNMVREAEIQTKKIYQETVDKLDLIYGSITDQKRVVQEFQDDYNALINRYIHHVNDREISGIYDKINDLDKFLSKLRNAPENEQQV